MKKELRNKILLAALLAVVLVLGATGCSLIRKIEVAGTWHDENGLKTVITETTISVYWTTTDTEPAYVYEIVDFYNWNWNSGEAGDGPHGYAVVLCTEPSVWNPGQEGTYTVYRWQNLMTSDGALTAEFAEGSPPTWPTGYAETASEAAEIATTENGWFAFGYVSSTLQ